MRLSINQKRPSLSRKFSPGRLPERPKATAFALRFRYKTNRIDYIFTRPENPIKAIARMDAVINAAGTPLKISGISA